MIAQRTMTELLTMGEKYEKKFCSRQISQGKSPLYKVNK